MITPVQARELLEARGIRADSTKCKALARCRNRSERSELLESWTPSSTERKKLAETRYPSDHGQFLESITAPQFARVAEPRRA